MLFIFLLLFFLCSSTHLCFAADTLSAGESLYQVETLVSAGGNFELGFFTPGASSNYYIAIWYKKISVRSKTPVWVANRDNPFSDPSSTGLKLLEDGNLVILNQSKEPIWTTNLTSKAKNTPELVLGDDGNLVLRDGSNSSLVLWQSFDHPTDTWLPGGKLRYDFRTKSPTPLTSWKNSENPAQGMFNMQMDPVVQQYLILQNGSTKYWTSGPWDGQIFSLVPEMRLNYIYNFSFVSNEVESYFTYDVFNRSIYSRFVMSLSGQVSQLVWLENTESWNLIWSQPRRQCEVHAICGTFSTCNEMVSPLCQCLPGFQPLSLRDWNLKDSSGGCVRNTTLQCGDKDKFWLMANMKLPENAVRLNVGSEKECMLNCLKDCSCVAYNYRSGCSIWTEAMLNIEPLSNDDGERRDLYLKLAVSEIRILRGEKNGSDHKKDVTVVIVITVIAGMLFLGFLLYVSWRWSAKQRGKNKDVVNLDFGRSNDTSKFSDTCKFGDNSELPIFDFEKLTIATNHFDSANKLGQGGFGPVYKGILSDGQEIAVKRLSKSSGQGLVEFKNEVVVISKLQHRNLVRLLGCCIQGEEKMLIYEYMPNKSLDYFIFDSTKQSLLDWSKRFEIIMGICRGILYLHRDSRLRVIHRDLKASNILLDHDLKPKISDFGMARIFGGDELQANTLRVVGTYGYMSPEYAMKGVFSEKSDVYSLGVLLLELVSGKRNSTFYHHEQFWTLLGYAWKLWTEGKTQELIDPAILGSCNQEEVVRCIHVGLLCVQDFAKNRPTMPSVISMLTSETPNLSIPEQPIFTGKEVTSDTDLSQESGKKFSRNNLSFTIMEGR